MSRSHVLFGVLAAANIGLGLHVYESYARVTAQSEAVRTLPPSVATMQSATGGEVGPLAGRIVVLAFVRASDQIAVDMMNRVSSAADSDSLRIILFSDRPLALARRVVGESVSVVRSSHTEWLTLVDASNSLEAWSVYDERGVQRTRGDFTSGGVAGAVGNMLGTMPEYSATLLAAQLRPHFAPDGSGFVDDVPSPAAAHIVLFVGELMSGCPIETALRTVDAAASVEGISFSVLVPPDWLDQEIEAMTVNLSLRTPVRRAPVEVAAAWRTLERIYGAAATAGFFVKFESGKDPEVMTETKPVLSLLGAGTT